MGLILVYIKKKKGKKKQEGKSLLKGMKFHA
jgi:hypothetical protein